MSVFLIVIIGAILIGFTTNSLSTPFWVTLLAGGLWGFGVARWERWRS
jgi:hypothetical protein